MGFGADRVKEGINRVEWSGAWAPDTRAGGVPVMARTASWVGRSPRWREGRLAPRLAHLGDKVFDLRVGEVRPES